MTVTTPGGWRTCWLWGSSQWGIYPKEERPVRDMLRRRAFLVRKKSSILWSMHGALECRTGLRVKANDLKT